LIGNWGGIKLIAAAKTQQTTLNTPKVTVGFQSNIEATLITRKETKQTLL
jgi:hypothetical protein